MSRTLLAVGDKSSHGGVIVTGDPIMLIDGKPVARIGDLHACPQTYPGGVPHSTTPIVEGSACPNRPSIRGIPAALSGDTTTCGAQLLPGSPNATAAC